MFQAGEMKRIDQFFFVKTGDGKRVRRREEYKRKEGEFADISGVTSGNLREKDPTWKRNYNLWLVEQGRHRGFKHHRAYAQKRIQALIGHFERLLAKDTEMQRTMDEIVATAAKLELEEFNEKEKAMREEAEKAAARQGEQLAAAQRNLAAGFSIRDYSLYIIHDFSQQHYFFRRLRRKKMSGAFFWFFWFFKAFL
jgi:hypothetical protein